MISAELEDKIAEENARVRLSQLGNGAWVVTRSDSSLPRIDCCCLFRVGAWDEMVTGHTRGIAHLLEHLGGAGYPKEGEHLAQFFHYKHYGANTSRMYTTYYGSQDKGFGLDPLAHMLRALNTPRFTINDVRRGENVLLNDLQREGHNRIHIEFAERAVSHFLEGWLGVLGGSPYELGAIGLSYKQVRSISQNEIHSFHADHYTSDRLIVAVEGDIDHDSVAETVEKNLSLPRKPFNVHIVPPYLGGDVRKSLRGLVDGVLDVNFGFPVVCVAPDKLLGAIWALDQYENPALTGTPLHTKVLYEEGLVYDYSVATRGLCERTEKGPNIFGWNFKTKPDHVEDFVRAAHQALSKLESWTGEGHESYLASKKKTMIDVFSKAVGGSRDARKLCASAAEVVFENIDGAMEMDYHVRQIIPFQVEDLNDMARRALVSVPTFRALGTLKGLPSPKKIQKIWAHG